MRADLHIHTTASDGHLSPEEVIAAAIQAGLAAIALTDHDTVAGLIALDQGGFLINSRLEIIPGIEFSTDLPKHEVHILGYNIDIYNEDLQQQLAILVSNRRQRVKHILAKLEQLGYQIECERVQEIAGMSIAVGRPHVARALVERGYFPTVSNVFEVLLYKNGPAYVPHDKLSPEAVIKLIKQAGGIPVLAHPGLVGDEDIVMSIISAGILGLEVFHPKHDPVQTQKYLKLAGHSNLLVTGGSDFHAIPTRFPEKLGIFTVSNSLAIGLRTNNP